MSKTRTPLPGLALHSERLRFIIYLRLLFHNPKPYRASVSVRVMTNIRPPALSWRPVLVAGICGLIVGASPFMYDILSMDRWLFSLGLFLTYTSIGVLVSLLPRLGPDWLFGIVIGAIYSLPGSILVAVLYPLRSDAPAYYTNFAAGGLEEFVTTMVFGIAVGWFCGLAIAQLVKENYPPEHTLV